MKPDADSQQQTKVIVEKHNQRWGAGDLEGIFALYDPGMVLTDHYTGKSYTGADLRSHIAQVIQRSRLDSLTYTDAVRVDGDTAVLQYSEIVRSASGNSHRLQQKSNLFCLEQGHANHVLRVHPSGPH
jgi:hypothetical protein